MPKNNTLCTIITLVGIILLLYGCFAPMMGIYSRNESIFVANYFMNGIGYGIYIMVLSVIALVMLLLKLYNIVWVVGVCTLTIITNSMVKVIRLLDSYEIALNTALTTETYSVSYEYAWILLYIGSLILVSTLFTVRKNKDEYWESNLKIFQKLKKEE